MKHLAFHLISHDQTMGSKIEMEQPFTGKFLDSSYTKSYTKKD